MTSSTATPSKNGASQIEADLAEDLPRMKPVIMGEYPEVSSDDLDRVGNDPQRVVDTIAAKTGHTRSLIVAQLRELHELQQTQAGIMNRMTDALDRIETKTRAAMRYAREDLPTEVTAAGKKARYTVEDNVWVSLLVALGLGFIVGFFVRSGNSQAQVSE